jgi:hypothetical protein
VGAPSDGRLPTIAILTDSAFQVQPLNGGQQRRKEVPTTNSLRMTQGRIRLVTPQRT